MFSKLQFRNALIAVCTFSLAACSATQRADESGIVQSGILEEATVEAVASVTKVDKATRDLTISTSDGRTAVIKAGPEVKNFDQIDAGDQIRVVYVESVAFDIRLPGTATPGVTVSGGTESAAAGKKPGAVGARMITITATIEAIDRNPDSVTLRGANGELRKINVRNPKHLENVKVGDLVEIIFAQAVAAVVEETN